MENQHRLMKGYRDLSEEEIALINEAKILAEKCGDLIEKLEKADFANTSDQVPDSRCLALGKTNLQQGFMWAIRSIAKPTTF